MNLAAVFNTGVENPNACRDQAGKSEVGSTWQRERVSSLGDDCHSALWECDLSPYCTRVLSQIIHLSTMGAHRHRIIITVLCSCLLNSIEKEITMH